MLHYTITPRPNAHQWHIIFTFHHSENATQSIKLANWVAGSYMIRDFAKHIIHIQATCNGSPVPLTQISKNEWQTPAQSGDYQIEYTVYANDLSVRASLLDNERGFIDGACLFLYLPERRDEACEVQFNDLPEGWRIETTLRQPENQKNRFQAADYASLTDCPFELGAHIETLHFTAHGIPHRIALSGHYPDFDRARLLADCQKICEHALALFSADFAPFSEYLFLLHLGDNIYGGLEHSNSTALHADRKAMPPRNMAQPTADYATLLGLISHEYFHAWNVKTIKPAEFVPYDLDQETYTEQLWAYEGITSYYDDLILARSQVISPEAYLNLLAQTITRVHRNAGRKQQTLAQSSFAAWHKYYKQDENSPNAITSYYQQGALAALCLDAHLRQNHRPPLDFVMRSLYMQTRLNRSYYTASEWQQFVQDIAQLNLADFFQAALHSTDDLPLERSLKTLGVELRWYSTPRSDLGKLVTEFPDHTPAPDIGCRAKQQADRATISHVFTGGSAEHAALKAGDAIIAINGYACTDFVAQTETQIGDRHTVHYFRHGVLHQTALTVQEAPAATAYLKIADRARLQAWLASGQGAAKAA